MEGYDDDNNRVDFREIGCEYEKWMDFALDSVQ